MTARRRPPAPPDRDPFEPLDGTPDHTLDLHGFGATDARDATLQFISRNQQRSPGALLHIITGKGRGSPGRPVLKSVVRTLLRSLERVEWGEDLEGGGFLVRLSR